MESTSHCASSDSFCYIRLDSNSPSQANKKWYFRPRFTSLLNYVKIFEADNSKGTQDFTIVEDISQGITSANSRVNSSGTEIGTAVSNTFTAGGETEVSGSYGPFGGSAGGAYQNTDTTETDMGLQVSAEFSEQSEQTRQKSVSTTFTAPAGKKYVVYQPTAVIKDLEDTGARDQFVFRSYNYLIKESPTKEEQDAADLKKRLYRKAMRKLRLPPVASGA